MPLLTFSIPAMLPMVVAGLRAAGGVLEPGVEAWAADAFAAETAAAAGWLKRQTCRRSPATPGALLHCWWRSPRNPRGEPRKLGVVALAACRPLHMASSGAGRLGVLVERPDRTRVSWPAAEFARADGFRGVVDAQAFFLPQPGAWNGFVWEW